MFAGAVTLLVATHPIAARAVTTEWGIGPLALVAGQSAEALIGDPNLSCSFGVQILAGGIGRDGAFPMTMRVNTYQDPDQSSAGHRLAVGFQDPNQVPGDVMLVQARVLALCPRTAAQLRRISVSLTTLDSLNGATTSLRRECSSRPSPGTARTAAAKHLR